MTKIFQRGATVLYDVAPPHFYNRRRTRELISSLQSALFEARALGLAAPQIGVSTRVFVTRGAMSDGTSCPPVCINPVVLEHSEHEEEGEESCLSCVDDAPVLVRRFAVVKVAFDEWTGARRERILHGLAARVFQHELDHLNGKLISEPS